MEGRRGAWYSCCLVNVVYYTSGIPGTGRIVQGISIYNALIRRGLNWAFTIVSSTRLAGIADVFGIPHIEIPLENENDLSPENWPRSALYGTLTRLKPDILVVDRMWFSLYHFLDELPCKKIFFSIQVRDAFYRIELRSGPLDFNGNQYDRVLAIEPFKSRVEMQQINPVILRNRDEIYDRETAADKLGLAMDKPVCLVALNYKEGYFEKLAKKYSYLDDEYEMFYTTNLKGGGVFPILDYFNAIDLVVSAAGYTQFWEVLYFEKEGIFETYPLNFTNMKWRVEECSDFRFEENGADQIVGIMIDL